MTKSRRKKSTQLTPRERLERLADKQLAHEMTIDVKREYYDTYVRPKEVQRMREERQAQQKSNHKIDERNRKRLAKQLDETKYSSKKTKIRFIHPK
ncbi:hypothetical protein [Leuconostoc citreum]